MRPVHTRQIAIDDHYFVVCHLSAIHRDGEHDAHCLSKMEDGLNVEDDCFNDNEPIMKFAKKMFNSREIYSSCGIIFKFLAYFSFFSTYLFPSSDCKVSLIFLVLLRVLRSLLFSIIDIEMMIEIKR
jgi:hypothetical protein